MLKKIGIALLMFFTAFGLTAAFAAEDLMYLSFNGTPDQIRAAIKAGADVNMAEKITGITPLINAAAYNPNHEVVAILIEAGADINKVGLINHDTALMWAASSNSNPEIIRILVKAGADVNAVPRGGWQTALNMAIFRNETRAPEKMVATLIEMGAKLEDAEGRTYLIEAVGDTMNPNPKIVAELIKAGTDVNARDKDGNTALISAAENENMSVEIINMLIAAGADLNAKNKKGVSALMMSIKYTPNSKIRTALLKAGAARN